MDQEEKTSPPTETARIDKRIWRIEYRVVYCDRRAKQLRAEGWNEILASIDLRDNKRDVSFLLLASKDFRRNISRQNF